MTLGLMQRDQKPKVNHGLGSEQLLPNAGLIRQEEWQMVENEKPGRKSRFMVVFANDGGSVTINAGVTDPEIIPLASMPTAARRHCFEHGLEQFARDAVANATKMNWSDSQCHGYMARKIKTIVAGQFRVGDGAADFHDFVTAIMRHSGKTDRSGVELAVLRWDTAKRDEWKNHKLIAIYMLEAKTARLAADLDPAAPNGSDLLADL